MAISLPSPSIVLADVEEIKGFNAEFVYNFFQPDEKTNDSGIATPEFIRKKSSESFNASYIESDQFNRFTSRYIKFSWRPAEYAPLENPAVGRWTKRFHNIKDNLEKIYHEEDFNGENFTLLKIQDLNIDKKINFLVEQLTEENEKKRTPLDKAKQIVETQEIPEEVNPFMIVEALTPEEEDKGYLFADKRGQKIPNRNLLKELTNNKQWLQINDKFYWTVAETARDDGLSIFRDEAEELLERAKDVEDAAKSDNDSSVLYGEKYDIELTEFIDVDTFRLRSPEAIRSFVPRKNIIGYLIDKTEITQDGQRIEHPPIVVESPYSSTTVDFRIKYGSTYSYTIRSIALVESQALNVLSKDLKVVLLKYLVSSKNSREVQITCQESVPPPSPVDFNVKWDRQKEAAFLSWSFPVNPQRDIKKWQIFRRASVEEPFELLRVIDFDDSAVPGPDGPTEYPNPDLIEYTGPNNPRNFYVDKEFGPDSKFIYTLCSVDAHGYSSNYGMQFECSFDRYSSRIVKKLVSTSGAPKAYPNMFYQSDMFVDAIKVSGGYKKLKIYFSPEYLDAVNSNGDSLELLKTSQNSYYKMSMINVDLQEQQGIDIRLLDKRSSLEQTISEDIEPPETFVFGKLRFGEEFED